MNLGLGILSWKAHKTLNKTLESFTAEFLQLFNDHVIYFNDIDDADRALAARFGFRAVGGPNSGIGWGTIHLAQALTTDNIILLQNDNPLIENAIFSKKHLTAAMELLDTRRANLVRLRHRWLVGDGFVSVKKYATMFGVKSTDSSFLMDQHNLSTEALRDSLLKKIKRILRPYKARRLRGRSVFIERAPEKIHPDIIRKDGEFFIIDSSAINYSDQPFLVRRDFFLEILAPWAIKHPIPRTHRHGHMLLEGALNCRWWRQSHFKIAQGTGLFTHARYDRPKGDIF